MAPSVYFDPSAPIMEFLSTLGESIEQATKEASKEYPTEDARDVSEETMEGDRDGSDRRQHHGPPGPHGPHGMHGPHGPHPREGPHCGGGRGGMWGGRGGGWGARGGGHHWGGRGGPWSGGPWGRHHHRRGSQDELRPAVDVFDTQTSYVIHVALPGAVKEDIGINYDADKSELQISGVVHRPGDEEFLKTLVSSERAIGAFDRKIKLGAPHEVANVEADEITAKLESGLLEITIPKKEKSPEQDKKKIEIS